MESYDQHSWLYDAAFSWDITDEVAWLLDRFGVDESGSCAVLEPACGSGRMVEMLARAGATVAGFDASATMLERARERFARAGLPAPKLVQADLVDCGSIEWGRSFDAAVLPIGTFGYLATDEAAARHLDGVAAQLKSGGSYFVQFEIRNLESFELLPPGPTNCWETPHPRGTIRCTVFGREWDPATRIETEVQRYDILDGPDAGFTCESEHPMHMWDWAGWQELIARSPFRETAAFDGNARGRPPLEVGPELEGRSLIWHRLELE